MGIPFTQYLLPDGRTRDTSIEHTREVEQHAQQFIARGGSFECELLTTGEVSLTAMRNDKTVAIEVVQNGPGMKEAVERLVRGAISAVVRP